MTHERASASLYPRTPRISRNNCAKQSPVTSHQRAFPCQLNMLATGACRPQILSRCHTQYNPTSLTSLRLSPSKRTSAPSPLGTAFPSLVG